MATVPRNVRTGFYRDGFCRTGADDVGQHPVSAALDLVSFDDLFAHAKV